MSAATVEELEVGDLDPAALLELASANEREIRERELLRLELAHQWAVLHPAPADTGVATPAGPALDVLTIDESLGGAGTPAVAAFTPEAFAAAIGMSPAAGASLIGDALDLRHRLPLFWKRVVRLQVCRPGRPCADDTTAPRPSDLWRYARTPQGHYLRYGPYGATYLVTPSAPAVPADQSRGPRGSCPGPRRRPGSARLGLLQHGPELPGEGWRAGDRDECPEQLARE